MHCPRARACLCIIIKSVESTLSSQVILKERHVCAVPTCNNVSKWAAVEAEAVAAAMEAAVLEAEAVAAAMVAIRLYVMRWMKDVMWWMRVGRRKGRKRTKRSGHVQPVGRRLHAHCEWQRMWVVGCASVCT